MKAWGTVGVRFQGLGFKFQGLGFAEWGTLLSDKGLVCHRAASQEILKPLQSQTCDLDRLSITIEELVPESPLSNPKNIVVSICFSIPPLLLATSKQEQGS